MSVISKDVLSQEALSKILPDSVYIKQTSTISRNVVKVSTDNQSAMGTWPAVAPLKFTLSPSNQLINLDECYIQMDGLLNFYKNDGTKTQNKLEDNLILVPDYWYMPCFNKIELQIGGVSVLKCQTPMNLVNFYISHYKSWTDKQNSNLVEKGIYPIPYANYETNTTDHSADFTLNVLRNFTFDDAKTYKQNMYNIQLKEKENAVDDAATFQNIIYLHDIFPTISTLRPIYGESIILIFYTENQGRTAITGTDIDVINYALIEKFTQFNLNVVSYQMTDDMIEKLNQVYSKEIICIYDDINYFTNSLLNTQANSTLELKIPMNIAFSADILNLSICQSNQNNDISQADWSAAHPILNHTILDNRFYPIKAINIFCDGQLLYTKNYSNSSITYCNNNIILKDIKSIMGAGVNVYDYTTLYKEYKESRYATYKNESHCVPFDEFISNFFSINVPLSSFTKLNTESNVILSIEMGAGIRGANLTIDSKYNDNGAPKLDQLKCIIKSKKALVFKGWNSCEVRTITQSFSNDITVSDNLNPTQQQN